jgi:acyl carrier protein
MSVDLHPLKDYLLNNLITDRFTIDDDEPIFTSGLIDSFGALNLLVYINEHYSVSIDESELTENSTDSLNDFGCLIENKIG